MLNFLTSAPANPWIEPGDSPRLRGPGAILEPAALEAELDALAREHRSDEIRQRAAILAAVRAALEAGQREIRRRFLEEHSGGITCMAEQAWLMDQIIRSLAHLLVNRIFPSPNPTVAERFAILATGGYGRGELAPQSDIDLLFLLPYKRTPRVEQVVEYMLYLLWDTGLKVGHAVRSVDECLRAAQQDISIRTALLEARPLWGDRILASDLRQRFAKEVVGAGNGADFVDAKLAERDERHRRLGDSRYLLEPNIKEGKGGLRDLQTLFWIAKYLYRAEDEAGLVEAGVLTREEADRLAKAHFFLATLRCHLHYRRGRPDDRLTFDIQPEIGQLMGYVERASASGVERFMKHYYLVAKDVGDLTRIFCAAMEAESRRRPRRTLLFGPASRPLAGFVVDAGRLNVARDRQFREEPLDMLRLFHTAQRHRLDIHPKALRLITRSLSLIGPKLRVNPEANRLFLEMLTSPVDPEMTLRRMNEAGVLGRFVPDFGRVVAQMQFDMYHVYTVDEHTLFALGTLHRMENGAAADGPRLTTTVFGKITQRRALYVALLLHDIAKGRGGDHSVLGARVARKLGPRFGLTEEETDLTEWLVRWHLLMSNVAFKRDLEDDKTIQDFAAAVAAPERLRLLLLLTIADISAVGPGRLNAWKANLLQQLYERTEDVLSGGLNADSRPQRVREAQDALRAELRDWPAEEIEAFVAKGYPPYWLAFDPETHARHARIAREAQRSGNPLVIDTRIDRAGAITELTIHTADHPGLFSRLAGALAVAGADVVDARIFTLADGMAMDVFRVQDAHSGGPFDAPEKLARLSVMIERSLSGQLRPLQELAKKGSAFPGRARIRRTQPTVTIDNDASRTQTLIEINGRDRPGLLYDLTRALTALNLQIGSAKISTYGERAVDAFYVKDVFGLKTTHEQKLAHIREGLLKVLAEGEAAPPRPPS